MTPLDGSSLDLGLIVAAVLFGLRHGVDWDHIAAITDITATQESPRSGLWYGTLYAAGHAGVVFLLGMGAIALGTRLPEWVDDLMARVVGVTLLVLGFYVVVSLIRHGKDFRLQSRWMLVIGGIRRAARYLRGSRRNAVIINHEHPHLAVESFHHDTNDPQVVARRRVHTHRHQHVSSDSYGTGTTLTIGALHGVGAETPTQVLVFLAAAGAGGTTTGVVVLIAFLIGLFTANTLVTLSSAYGFVSATRHPRIYMTLASVTAVVSLILGSLYLVGADAAIPPLLGG